MLILAEGFKVSFPEEMISKLRSRAKKELVKLGVDRGSLLRRGLNMFSVLKVKVSAALGAA